MTQVDFKSGVEELRRRLEVLLGAKPEAPVDVTKREEVDGQDGAVGRAPRARGRGGRRDAGRGVQLPRRVGLAGSGAAARRAAGGAGSQPIDRVRGGRPVGPAAVDASRCPTAARWTRSPRPWPASCWPAAEMRHEVAAKDLDRRRFTNG